MKVSELIEELQAFDPEAEVHFSYGYMAIIGGPRSRRWLT